MVNTSFLVGVGLAFSVMLALIIYLLVRGPKKEIKTVVEKVPVRERKTLGMEDTKPRSRIILDAVKNYDMNPEPVAKSTTYIGAEDTFDDETGQAIRNDIVIRHNTVSRSHAQVVRTDSGFKILNRSRTNPVRVNGEIADDRLLNDGDTISIGAVELRVIA